MTATQPRPGVQLPLRSPTDEQSASSALPAVLWWDVRDQVWRGLIPSLSLFAEAETQEAVRGLLAEKANTYLQDAVEQGLEQDLVPRPLPVWEWRKLWLYLWSLRVRAGLANLLFPSPRTPTPVVQRVPVYWRG